MKRELFPFFLESVVELIRHLPTINFELVNIIPEAQLINHVKPQHIERLAARLAESTMMKGVDENEKHENNDNDEDNRFPPYFLPLADGNRNGAMILIDTKYGRVIWWEFANEFPGMVFPQDTTSYLHYAEVGDRKYDPDGPTAWMNMPAFTPEVFVELIKDQFRSLKWVANLADDGAEGVRVSSQAYYGSEMVQILRDAGWPGDNEGNR